MMEMGGGEETAKDGKETPPTSKINIRTKKKERERSTVGRVSPPPPPTLVAGSEKNENFQETTVTEQSLLHNFSIQYDKAQATSRRDTFSSSHSMNPKRATMKELTAGKWRVVVGWGGRGVSRLFTNF